MSRCIFGEHFNTLCRSTGRGSCYNKSESLNIGKKSFSKIGLITESGNISVTVFESNNISMLDELHVVTSTLSMFTSMFSMSLYKTCFSKGQRSSAL